VFIAVGDFNGDQKPDLAVVNLTTSVTVLLGDGLGGFGHPRDLFGTDP
jgi:hypothetical protein